VRLAAGAVVGLLAQAAAAAAQEEALRLPSGLEARVQDVLTDRPAGGGLTYRFRFVAAGFESGEERLEQVMKDLEWLCTRYALPRISNIGPQPGRIVISLSDRPSEFGVYDPAVTQVFEAFRPAGEACIWEMF